MYVGCSNLQSHSFVVLLKSLKERNVFIYLQLSQCYTKDNDIRENFVEVNNVLIK